MSSPVREPEVQAQPVPQITSQQEDLDVQSTTPTPGIHTAGREQTGHYPGSHCIKQMDIRRFLRDGDHSETIMFKDMGHNTGDIKEEPFDKMRMIRNKMVEARRAVDRDSARETKARKTPMNMW